MTNAGLRVRQQWPRDYLSARAQTDAQGAFSSDRSDQFHLFSAPIHILIHAPHLLTWQPTLKRSSIMMNSMARPCDDSDPSLSLYEHRDNGVQFTTATHLVTIHQPSIDCPSSGRHFQEPNTGNIRYLFSLIGYSIIT
jgi:hypothetical protein